MKCFILFLISFLVLPEYCDLLGQTNNEFRYLIGEWVGSGGGSGSGQEREVQYSGMI